MMQAGGERFRPRANGWPCSVRLNTQTLAWIRIRGYEAWRIGADGLIADSNSHVDVAYRRQLARGVGG